MYKQVCHKCVTSVPLGGKAVITMDVVTWLEQVRKLDELINAKITEREQVWDMLTSVTASEMDDMPHAKGTVSDPVGTGVVRLQMLSVEIDNLVDRYVDLKANVIKALEKLSANEYGVLHRYYIRYMTWESVAEDMGYCRQQIWRLKNKGLKNLENVIECNSIMCYNGIVK